MGDNGTSGDNRLFGVIGAADATRPDVASRSMPGERLVSTGEAARALGVSSRSLARWAREGRLKPALVTPGGDQRPGQYRWDLDDLREQLRQLRRRAD
jgi:Helix-turn-helix domain